MRRWNFQGNILVSNISEGMTPAGLAALFDDYGMVLGVQIKEVISNAGTRLLGVVALAPDKAADEAITGLQGRVVDSLKLKLKRCVQKPKEKLAVSAAPRRPRAPVGPPPDDFLPIPRPMAMRDARFPASHAPSGHSQSAYGQGQNFADAAPYSGPAPRREPVVVETRTPKKVIVEYKSGAGRIARPAAPRAKTEAD